MKDKYILLKNINTLVTMNDDLSNNGIMHYVHVLIKNHVINYIEKNLPSDINYKNTYIIDCSNRIVYPGFINTHHHFYQSLTRNIPFVQNAKLFDWLINLYEIWHELDEDFVKLSTKIAVGELLLSGCTTTTDHYYIFPRNASSRLLDLEIDTALNMGIRFYPNRGSMSKGRSNNGLPADILVQNNDEIINDYERIIKKYHDNKPYSMCRIILAPCSPFSVTTDLLRETADFARYNNLLMHTHLCETIDEENYCLNYFNRRPLQYMSDCNWLGDDVFYAHGVHFNDYEIKLLSETGTGISHCPSSNLRLGSGICPVNKLIQAGVRLGLSVDGSSSNDSSNYVREMQIASLIHRLESVNGVSVMDVLKMATIGGANILKTPEIGIIKEKAAADIAIFNLRKLDYAGAMSDPAAAIVMCGSGTRTDYTIVNGKIIVKNGNLINLNEELIFDESVIFTKKIIENTSKRTNIDYYSYH